MAGISLTRSAPRPRVSAGSAGEGGIAIARGLQQIGQAGFRAGMAELDIEERQRQTDHSIEMAELERKRQAEVADAAGRYAEYRAGLETFAEELRISPTAKPGGEGHAAAMRAEAERRQKEFLGTLSHDPAVRQRFEPMLQGSVADFVQRETAWEIKQRGQHQGNQWKVYSDANIIELNKKPTFENLQAKLNEAGELAGAMGLPATTREALLTATRQSYVQATLQAQIDGGNQAGARDILTKGNLDPYLTPESREALLNSADRADNRARIEAERAEADQRRSANQILDALEEMLRQGVTPTEAEMAAGRAAIKLLPPAEQVKFAGMETQLDVNKLTTGKDAATIRHERDQLQAKVNSGKASQTEQMYLQAYNKRLDVQMDAEAEQGRAQLGEGTAGRISAVEAAINQPAQHRFALLEKQERGLGHVSLLPSASSRRMAIEGRAIRKAQPDLFKEADAKTAFRAHIGSVGAMLGEQYDDKLGIAMDLYAKHVSAQPQKEFNANLFAEYVSVTMGATRRADGVWQGGLATVNGRRTLLPDLVSADEMRSSLARADWSAARNKDGQPVAKDWIIKHMAPVLVEELPDQSIYHMRDGAGGLLMGPNGRPLRYSLSNGKPK